MAAKRLWQGLSINIVCNKVRSTNIKQLNYSFLQDFQAQIIKLATTTANANTKVFLLTIPTKAVAAWSTA